MLKAFALISQQVKKALKIVKEGILVNGTTAISKSYNAELEPEEFLDHLVEIRPVQMCCCVHFINNSYETVIIFSFEHNKTEYCTRIWTIFNSTEIAFNTKKGLLPSRIMASFRKLEENSKGGIINNPCIILQNR